MYFTNKDLSDKFDEGNSAMKIAKETGLSSSQVRKQINSHRTKNGLPTIAEMIARKSKENRRKVIRLKKSGLNGREISRQENIPYDTVSQIMHVARSNGDLPPFKPMKAHRAGSKEPPKKLVGLVPYAGQEGISSSPKLMRPCPAYGYKSIFNKPT
ncbi:MAG: helix-turn-helix domain-containing protein [Planctomycetes bacterium]|nr:helix-turn-helix domain-containing protein [Planctomycetota bacterium]